MFSLRLLQGVARAASLQSRAWILQLAALELHTADAAVPGHRTSVASLLRALFAAPTAAGDGANHAPCRGFFGVDSEDHFSVTELQTPPHYIEFEEPTLIMDAML